MTGFKTIQRTCACLLLYALSVTAQADLVFEKSSIAISPDLLAKEAQAAFIFTNNGDKPVTITRINSSCGCTAAVAKDKVIKPGESSQIETTFTFGDRHGKQIKRIVLNTDHPKQPRITLTLSTNIPRIATFKPAALVWRADDLERAPKQTKLTIAQDKRVKLIGLGKLPTGIKATLEEVDKKKQPGVWTLRIDPNTTDEALGGGFSIPVKIKLDGKETQHNLRGRIIMPKPPRATREPNAPQSQDR